MQHVLKQERVRYKWLALVFWKKTKLIITEITRVGKNSNIGDEELDTISMKTSVIIQFVI